MKTRHHVAVQMEEEQQLQKDNGSIVKTVDQLWKYSGEVEKSSIDYANMMVETAPIKLSAKEYLTAKRYKSRKEYHKLYWLNNKLKQKS